MWPLWLPPLALSRRTDGRADWARGDTAQRQTDSPFPAPARAHLKETSSISYFSPCVGFRPRLRLRQSDWLAGWLTPEVMQRARQSTYTGGKARLKCAGGGGGTVCVLFWTASIVTKNNVEAKNIAAVRCQCWMSAGKETSLRRGMDVPWRACTMTKRPSSLKHWGSGEGSLKISFSFKLHLFDSDSKLFGNLGKFR